MIPRFGFPMSRIASIFAMFALLALPALSLAEDDVEFTSTDLGGGIYMLAGAGGNLGLSVGNDGVLLIDSELPALTEQVMDAVAEITDAPVDFLVNTHWHWDHTGANEVLQESGTLILAHDNVRVRMAAPGDRQSPDGALPVITFSATTTFHWNGEEIHAFHPGHAHTDGDVIIHFRNNDVIHTGDVLFNGRYPFIDAASGGSVDGYIAALQKIADMAGPGTRIIPGHGPLASKTDVETSIAMLQDARSRIMSLIEDGRTLDEVKAADPLQDYHDDWAWSFIDGPRMTEILYEALSKTSRSGTQ